MLPKYDLLVPARRSTAWAAIITGAFQTAPPARIVVLDTADRPLTSRYEFRMAADIAVERGIEWTYLRGRHNGIRAARLQLGNAALHPVLAWLDDDCLMEPHAAERCLALVNKNAVSCRMPTPNNEYESDIWEPPLQAPPPFSYGAPLPAPVQESRCGFGSVFMAAETWPVARAALLDPDTVDGFEDRTVWAALGGVTVAPDAFSWEMKHSEARVFAPYVEALS